MNESITSCVAYADAKASSFNKISGLRVNIAALRKQGFSIEIAPPATDADYHKYKTERRVTKKVRPELQAAYEDLVRQWTHFPPFGATRKVAEAHGVTHGDLSRKLQYMRRRDGIKMEATA